MTEDEVEAFRLKLKNGAKNIYWRDCDGLVFRVIGFHPAYAESDDVPEPVAVLEGNKTASLLNSTAAEYYELVPLQLRPTDIVAEVQNVIHEAIISNDRVGAAYERIIQALFDSYDVFQASHLVDRARLEHVIRIALMNATHGSRPREVVAEALLNHFKLVPKRT